LVGAGVFLHPQRQSGSLRGPPVHGKVPVMTAEPPISPWKLTPPRILLLVLGVLAILLIVGSIMGGVGNYEMLKESVPSSSSAPAGGG
jgi:hypothetical protein